MLELLGIEISRQVTRTVVAEKVYIPRVMNCANGLLNPTEIRLLASELIKASLLQVKVRQKIRKKIPSFVISKNNNASGIPQGLTEGNKKEKRERIRICNVTSVQPPSTLPIKILIRDTGATSTALSTSSFRSQTI